MNAYTNVFGGNTVWPSDVSFLALALTADVTLEWPLEASTGDNIVARIIDVTPTGAYAITMPPANETGVGNVTTFFNAGASTITVKNNAGSTLLSIAAGLTYTLYLTTNTTAAGTWRSFQAGASTAQAQASALAGYGLVAQGSLLSQSQMVNTFSTNYTAGVADRAATYVWTGGLGTLTLTAASTLGNNWFMGIRNSGSGNLTIAPSGADTINGAATLVLAPGDSANINTDGTSFYTVGLGQSPLFAFDYTSIDLTGHVDTYTLSGSELNRIAYDFVGALTTNMVIIVPATTQQYWVSNDTTGGSYTLSIGTATQGSPVGVTRGARGIYYCQGTEVVNADTASVATPFGISSGGTGATSASGARINLGGTTVGIGVFTAASAAAGRTALSAATSGANSDITSLTGLTTPLPISEGGTGLTTFGTGVATALGQNVTGSGGIVLATSPTLTTPALGTPSAINLANGTNLPIASLASLGTGVATALAANVSGSGGIVLVTSATLVTPTLGAASATSINKVAFTAPASSATLTLADGKTLTISNSLTLAGTDTTTMTFPPASASVGYLNIPQNSQSTDYTAVLGDSGKQLFHPAADTNNRTFTIPANASVAYTVGTAISFINMSANNLAIAITSDTLYLAGAGSTGSRTLQQYGVAVATKITATSWIISGSGLG